VKRVRPAPCTPELHRSLSNVCRASGSKLSVITVEYDAREDLPEGTDAFTLEPSSSDFIKKLVARRLFIVRLALASDQLLKVRRIALVLCLSGKSTANLRHHGAKVAGRSGL
jgi:hypothetical protein